MTIARRLSLFCLLVLASAALASTAEASQLIDRNATGVKLQVSKDGVALVSYHAAGKAHAVLASGAANAIPPTPGKKQVAFKLDYSGKGAATFKNVCTKYSGPKLAWYVTACRAPDGSFWALQSWQRMLPNYGLAPSAAQAASELRLSHWTGDLPVLAINLDWAYGQFDHLWGSVAYAGSPVFGFKSTSGGVPLDTFGRNIYVDTHDSAYGKGWHRENSFLGHTNTGTFCYAFVTHGKRPLGKGDEYRATVEGPGVAPDVMWQAHARGIFDPVADKDANAQQTALGDKLCTPN